MRSTDQFHFIPPPTVLLFFGKLFEAKMFFSFFSFRGKTEISSVMSINQKEIEKETNKTGFKLVSILVLNKTLVVKYNLLFCSNKLLTTTGSLSTNLALYASMATSTNVWHYLQVWQNLHVWHYLQVILQVLGIFKKYDIIYKSSNHS